MSTETLIHKLQNPKLYPHNIERFKVIQTHLSWVILTGPYAYKIKKPLNLGFNDYSTLKKRKYYSELELELNKALAPDIYLDVLPITGDELHPILNGQSSPIEYAIKMKEFPQDQILLELEKKDQLTPEMMKSIASQLATFHLHTQHAQTNTTYGAYETLFEPMQDNFDSLKELEYSKPYQKSISEIEQWAKQQHEHLKPLLLKRKQLGFIRACHGDLHLGNIVLINEEPIIFDCIEFNEEFRWIDVISDVAFLTMDLTQKKQPELAQYFVNQYLEISNDYEGIQLLNYYQSYRAMIRAKISAITLGQLKENEPTVTLLQQELKEYINLALSYTQPKNVNLTITYGPSGCGKSVYSERLAAAEGAIRLRSDILRKHMFHLNIYEHSPEPLKKEIYSSLSTQKLYALLKEHTKNLINAGFSVIVDATFLKSWQRDLFEELSKTLSIPFTILKFNYTPEQLRSRLNAREHISKEASDANVDVLEQQLIELEPLSDSENEKTTVITF